MTDDVPIKHGLLSVKDASLRLKTSQHVLREAVAKNLIEPAESRWGRNAKTGDGEWEYQFSSEAVDVFGVWLRAQAHADLQVQDEFQFGVRKRLYNYNLRAARLKLGLTGAQLGEQLGVSGATVVQWENLRRFPSPMQRKTAADFLGLPIALLFPDWLIEFKLERGPSVITDAHYSLERALAARIDLPSLPAPNEGFALKEAMADVLNTLTDREALVLRERYGLDSDDGLPHTNEEVGRKLGVTRERIRQIEQKALRKLRHPTRSRKLRDFLGE